MCAKRLALDKAPAVADTTPLITLAGVGLFDLLPQLYGHITVPRAVVAEYQVKASSADPDLQQLSWLTIVDNVMVDPTLPPLGPGEAAAISLAKLLSAQFVLLDERKAREMKGEYDAALDPLAQFLGAFEADAPDVVRRHDAYLGEAYADQHDAGE